MKGFIKIQEIQGVNAKEVLINISHIRCIASFKNGIGNKVSSIIYGDGECDYVVTEKSLKELEELILEASK